MTERFELFRLSLLERDQFDMFSASGLTRKEWLHQVFNREIPFSHHGTEFYFYPEVEESEDKIIVGRVGRHLLREENLPPDEGLQDVTRDAWVAALLVLDPTEHEDGQKLAIQNVAEVGKPASLVKTMIGEMNNVYNGPYQIAPSQVVEAQTFWDFVKDNKGGVTSISFDFIAPNMLGADDEFHDEMREFKNSEKARKIKLQIQSDDGVNPETERVKRAVNYALLESRGKVAARAKGGKRYNSSKEIKITYLDGAIEKGVSLVKTAKELSSKILGRE